MCVVCFVCVWCVCVVCCVCGVGGVLYVCCVCVCVCVCVCKSGGQPSAWAAFCAPGANQDKRIFEGHIINNRLPIFYLCIINGDTLASVVQTFGQ